MKTSKTGSAIFIALFMGILLSYAVCNRHVRGYREILPVENLRAEALMVNPDLYKIAAGEFKGLLADYLLLKASVFIGGIDPREITSADWNVLAVLYKQSLMLDPYFYQTAYYTQGVLVWQKGLQGKAIELLQIYADHRYWDWEPKFWLGFDYSHFFKDNVKASHYLFEAAKLRGAPPLVATLGARLAQRSNQTLTALIMLKMLHEQAGNEVTKKLLQQRIDAYQGIYRIEQALSEYVKRYGQRPAVLEDLIKVNILDSMPPNPFGPNFFYDPGTGHVFFDEIR